MLTAALAYASRGIPVLPLHTPLPGGACSCRRRGCDRPGKHPRLAHGLLDASTDPVRVAGWWRRWPAANIGLCTGVAMDVVDVDSDEGRHALTHLTGGAPVPPGPLARTGSGGWHAWLRPTGAGNRVRLLPGVDWRGAGGYVVAPPSRHASGADYRWLRGPHTPLPGCPPALRELLFGPPATARPAVPRPGAPHHPDRYAAAALRAEVERVATAPVGTRNDTLNRAAYALGRLAAAGLLDAALVHRALTTAARRSGLGPAETARTVRSGFTAGARRGRAA